MTTEKNIRLHSFHKIIVVLKSNRFERIHIFFAIKIQEEKKRYFQTQIPICNQINLMVASHSQLYKSSEILRMCQTISSCKPASLPSVLSSLQSAANTGCIPAGLLPYIQAFCLANHYILCIFSFNSKLPVCYFTLMALTVTKKNF